MMLGSTIFVVAIAVALASNAPTYPSTSGISYESYPSFNGPKIPQNRKPSNDSYPDDGCGDYSVRYKGDGYCYPVLKKGPCENVLFWITVDPYTYEVKMFSLILLNVPVILSRFCFFVFLIFFVKFIRVFALPVFVAEKKCLSVEMGFATIFTTPKSVEEVGVFITRLTETLFVIALSDNIHFHRRMTIAYLYLLKVH
jgi:hypothetical protein